MDGSSELHAAAHERKVRTYAPLLDAMQAYLDEGWQVEIFPWVVGVRGLVNSPATKRCLEFLEMQRKSWRRIIEDTAKDWQGVGESLLCHTTVRCKAALQIGPWSEASLCVALSSCGPARGQLPALPGSTVTVTVGWAVRPPAAHCPTVHRFCR